MNDKITEFQKAIEGSPNDKLCQCGQCNLSAFERLGRFTESLVRADPLDIPSFDPADVVIEPYESMTREELIECLYTHDAHHQEHHEREKFVRNELDGMSNGAAYLFLRASSNPSEIQAMAGILRHRISIVQAIICSPEGK